MYSLVVNKRRNEVLQNVVIARTNCLEHADTEAGNKDDSLATSQDTPHCLSIAKRSFYYQHL